AISSYQSALSLNESNTAVRVNLAAAMHSAGQIADATQEYQKVLAAEPDSMDAANNLAWILATTTDERLRDAAQALRLAQSVVDCDDGRQPSTLDTLSVAYAATGDRESAIRIARVALQIAQLRQDESLAEKISERLRRYEQE
ncbi:MAG: hypothetical protein KDB27_14365, partial [Planctomycetales bacterium]|nr:hypothetical protein [Planctomycetales bacterium]